MTTATKAPTEWRLLEPGEGPLTVDDWFTREDFPDRCELFQGMLLMAPPPGGSHQAVTGQLSGALGLYNPGNGGVVLAVLDSAGRGNPQVRAQCDALMC